MMLNELCVREWQYLAAKGSYKEARLVLAGLPLELTVSFRPGTREGPQAIRAASQGLEEYSPYLREDLNDHLIFDCGDLALPFGNLQVAFQRIEALCRVLLADAKIPVFLGGEHLITFPVVKTLAEAYSGLKVLHFDAHADLRDDYLGEKYSHATVIRRVCEIVGAGNVYQFGIRSGTKEEFEYGRSCTVFYPFEILPGLESCLQSLEGHPVYVTVDIDVIDPAYAPGTGTPEPGGVTPQELFRVFELLEGCRIVGCDFVELAPVYDRSGITSILAAKLVREALLAFSRGVEGRNSPTGDRKGGKSVD
ncbi:MAG: Agmatinase SpeB [Thermacetogenium phaeum]|uniref:Agmatinase SpeB n=1 Tax=Thermacetogenium phaeum TaxID=85874 RepID=A0A101FGZ9_9THEO|nr:MAG: Agmatinase SpeB [Thermacetogenium phaeum]